MTPDDFLDVAGIDNEDLLNDLKQMLLDAEKNRPRSQQRTLGPSEVGHPCMRKLAHATVASRKANLTTTERGANSYDDPLAAMIGTGAHTVMEEAARSANDALGEGNMRWIPESRVTVRPPESNRPGLSGTADLYDLRTHTVLDWKFPGVTRYKHYVAHGPSPTYRGQAHLYGRGYKNMGFPVSHVGIIFVSRTGTLRQMHLWREPYSDELVDEILTRLDDVDRLIDELNLEQNPAGFPQVPMAPDDDCERTCGWWSPIVENGYQCPGKG
ncbi:MULTISPECIES: hypothetical protein [Nocardia]|uniref:hypothetical protein n=1 Tax=Nocardia TaxID=1817 RepID=UPI0007A50DBD|nr:MULTISPECIES: hypothetical protein [Nocardia]